MTRIILKTYDAEIVGPDAERYAADVARAFTDLSKAREMVKRFIVAQGPHLYEAWREALIKDCGLVEDALGFVSVPPIGVDADKSR